MRTNKTVVVLISGKAGAGKTTVAHNVMTKMFEKFPSLTVFNYSFASPIKYMAGAYGNWKGEKDEPGRALLQGIGQVFRAYDQDIWVKHMLNQAEKKSGVLPFNFIIVDDWRFPNELAYLQTIPSMDIYTVRVGGRAYELNGNVASDVSENSLPVGASNLYDMYLDNSIEGLENVSKMADKVVEDLRIKFILE